MSKKTEENAVAIKQNTALAAAEEDFDVSQFGSGGLEQADADSYAIPFLMVLQKGSPQVDEASGVAIEGAKQGMLYDNIAQEMFDGKEGIEVVHCNYRRTYIRWGAEDSNEGFKGELSPEVVATMRESGDIVELENRLYVPLSDGTVHEKKCDRIVDTRNHYVLIIDPKTGAARPALLSLSSTQIKKSKAWNTDMNNIEFKREDGSSYKPATFATVYRVTTVPESNNKGNWFGWRFTKSRRAPRALVQQAHEFYLQTKRGDVQAKYEDVHSAEPAAPEKF